MLNSREMEYFGRQIFVIAVPVITENIVRERTEAQGINGGNLPVVGLPGDPFSLTQRVHVPNNLVLGFWIIAIIVLVSGK